MVSAALPRKWTTIQSPEPQISTLAPTPRGEFARGCCAGCSSPCRRRRRSAARALLVLGNQLSPCLPSPPTDPHPLRRCRVAHNLGQIGGARGRGTLATPRRRAGRRLCVFCSWCRQGQRASHTHTTLPLPPARRCASHISRPVIGRGAVMQNFCKLRSLLCCTLRHGPVLQGRPACSGQAAARPA